MLTFIRTCAALGFALWFVPAGLGRLTLPGQPTALRIAAGGALGLVVFELLTLLCIAYVVAATNATALYANF